MSVEVEPISGPRLTAALPDLARLRIAVFRDWPYLYLGSPDYESRYLRAYASSAGAVVIVAREGRTIVGMATAAPMEDHAAEFAAPFRARGQNPADVLYLGESVLLPEWRGKGIGHAFFDAREAHGRALGRRIFAFSAVVRDAQDPRRPPGHRDLNPFWLKRGYRPEPGLIAEYAWAEPGSGGEIRHEMQFWLRHETDAQAGGGPA